MIWCPSLDTCTHSRPCQATQVVTAVTLPAVAAENLLGPSMDSAEKSTINSTLVTCRRRAQGSLFVPNSPQPQPCWPLSTQGPHPTLLDGESRWWCCGISLRYACRRHLARKASAARLAQHVREAHRERGSLGAGRGPASRDETTALRIPTTPWTLCGFVLWLPRARGLGAVRMVAAPAPSLRPQRLSSAPASHGESNQDLLLANSGLSRRLASLNARSAYLVGLMLGWCWGREG